MNFLSLLSHRSSSGGGDGDFTLFAIGGVALGLFLFYSGFKEWNKFKRVADTSTSKVRSMAAGLVELNGKVTAIQKLFSPVTHTECVYYRVEHQTYVRSKRGGHWVTTSVDHNSAIFYLEDETGKVEIDPRQADIDIAADQTRYYGASRRDIEYNLASGDVVYVLGTAKIKPGVRTAENAVSFIVTQGEGDKFFYISDKKEKDVQAKLSGTAKWSIAGGVIITVLSVGYLVFRFGL